MDALKLKEVIEKHGKWLRGEAGGERANLGSANLGSANLGSANLGSADLRYANLSSADLRYADLRYANLSSADLSSADLRYANLSSADLRYADLRYANLSSANLSSAKNIEAAIANEATTGFFLGCPESGTFEGWKKCRYGVLVRVQIPAKAKRSSATSRKCRAEYVKVLEVVGAEVGVSSHDNKTEYRKGATVRCDSWDENRWNECSGGIHFFLTRREAELYTY